MIFPNFYGQKVLKITILRVIGNIKKLVRLQNITVTKNQRCCSNSVLVKQAVGNGESFLSLLKLVLFRKIIFHFAIIY